ncbi:MAG TPA: nitroreductase family deazaflavin-dependent oxidoreductase [Acidimicrobiia bacterium]|jgi:deazaflavin-dependent oxidoreductase (nitroreductase family)|nr:nitroreductase family deazaflavin-dependent oxidoreductase [Acidimicrobiia bacterium]
MDYNDKIIEEFRAKGGKLPGPAEGSALLLLHTRGARSGAERVNPVTYLPLADGWAIFAAHAGAAKHPDWFHNLVAHPETIIEVGTETVPVRARVATGEERVQIWARQKAFYPRFAKYEAMTSREIPVIVLERMTARRPGSRGLELG